jgi:hypothetical protein
LSLEGVAVEEVDRGSADVEESEDLGRLETGEQVVQHGAVVVHGALGGDCPAVGSGEIALDEDAAGVGDADVAEIFVESLTVEAGVQGALLLTHAPGLFDEADAGADAGVDVHLDLEVGGNLLQATLLEHPEDTNVLRSGVELIERLLVGAGFLACRVGDLLALQASAMVSLAFHAVTTGAFVLEDPTQTTGGVDEVLSVATGVGAAGVDREAEQDGELTEGCEIRGVDALEEGADTLPLFGVAAEDVRR